jgi:hypothetical protein
MILVFIWHSYSMVLLTLRRGASSCGGQEYVVIYILIFAQDFELLLLEE